MQRLRIYAFKDPRDGKIYYIGKSRNPYVRLGEHYRDQRPPTLGTPKGGFARRYNPEMAAWLDSLIQADIFPEVVILHVVEESEDWQQLEIKYIAEHKAAGQPLVNKTIGGKGGRGLKRTPEWKAERSAWMQGRKVSDETKAKISAHMKAQPIERYENMREGFKVWASTEDGKKALATMKGVPTSARQKQAAGKASKERWAAMTPEQRAEFCRLRGERYKARTEKRKPRNAPTHRSTT